MSGLGRKLLKDPRGVVVVVVAAAAVVVVVVVVGVVVVVVVVVELRGSGRFFGVSGPWRPFSGPAGPSRIDPGWKTASAGPWEGSGDPFGADLGVWGAPLAQVPDSLATRVVKQIATGVF